MNPSPLTLSHFESRIADARRHADAEALAAQRPRTVDGRQRPQDYAEHVVIRSAVATDDVEIARLAQLDSGRVPAGAALVAELRGRLVAVIGIDGGPALADPFEPTGDVVRLLEMRAAQLRTSGNGSGDGRGLARDGHAAASPGSGVLRFMRRGTPPARGTAA